jgi:integrase
MGSIYKQRWKDKNGTVHESRIWWIKYYRDGKPVRETTETEKITEARTFLKRREGDVAKGVPVSGRELRIKFSELADAVINDYKNNELRTLADLERRLDKHILPIFGHRRAASITTPQIQDFINKRREEGATNGEINRELAIISKAYTLALRHQVLMFRPHVPRLAEKNIRKGFFEREQFERLLQHLPSAVQPLIHFAHITGWRIKSEVQALRWTQVDLASSIVRLEPGTTKNGEGREFPITAELRDVLEEQGRKADRLLENGTAVEYVFFWDDGRQIRDFRSSWLTACIKAGLAKEVEVGRTENGDPILEQKAARIPHDFRRTAVRNLVRAGVDRDTAMKMVGHETDSVFRRYNIINTADLEDAGRKLDGLQKGRGHETGIGKAENPQFRVLDSRK